MTTIEETIDLILREFAHLNSKIIQSHNLQNKLQIPHNTFIIVIERMITEKLINSSNPVYIEISSLGEEIQKIGYKKWQKEEMKIKKAPVNNYKVYIIISIIGFFLLIIISWENLLKLFVSR